MDARDKSGESSTSEVGLVQTVPEVDAEVQPVRVQELVPIHGQDEDMDEAVVADDTVEMKDEEIQQVVGDSATMIDEQFVPYIEETAPTVIDEKHEPPIIHEQLPFVDAP